MATIETKKAKETFRPAIAREMDLAEGAALTEKSRLTFNDSSL